MSELISKRGNSFVKRRVAARFNYGGSGPLTVRKCRLVGAANFLSAKSLVECENAQSTPAQDELSKF
jgi:hypothetical protein